MRMRNQMPLSIHHKTNMGVKLVKGIVAFKVIVAVALCLSVGTLAYMGGKAVIDNGGIENTIVYVGKSIKRIGERISDEE